MISQMQRNLERATFRYGLKCFCGISLWAVPGKCDPADWRRHEAHMSRFERASHTPAYWAKYRGE